ncbi:uncharacterized protein [Miscanthus floridulus]|uniref:uncharacterized protein isoform X1 n=1 Tax=Miscanthus floridulus TaxID=154761 RepID=UPI00345A2242
MHYVHPSVGERYYLWLLLLTAKGCTSFEDVRFHNRLYHRTFKEACRSRGLLGDDQEWYDAFDEAAAWATSSQLRILFVTMVLFCEVGDENTFFEKVWRHLCDDIQYQYRETIGDPNYRLPDDITKHYLLDELARLFAQGGRDIRKFNLPSKNHAAYPESYNRLIEEELSHPIDPLLDMDNPTASLNADQTHAFTTIVQRVLDEEPGLFFVSGYGGTGKTFLWNRIVSYVRAKQRIVLTVTSSGVAALLLPGGRTAHSRFKIPCDLDDDTICDISRGNMLVELIEMASLVIWDEAFMTNGRAFEALDRTFRDIDRIVHRVFSVSGIKTNADLTHQLISSLPTEFRQAAADIPQSQELCDPLDELTLTIDYYHKNVQKLHGYYETNKQKYISTRLQTETPSLAGNRWDWMNATEE